MTFCPLTLIRVCRSTDSSIVHISLIQTFMQCLSSCSQELTSGRESTFALQLFCCLCPIMKLYTKFYGSIKEEAINSLVSGSQGGLHIETGPQGMKGKGHSGRQKSKKGTCSRNREHYHTATAQFGAKGKKVIEDGTGKKGNKRF